MKSNINGPTVLHIWKCLYSIHITCCNSTYTPIIQKNKNNLPNTTFPPKTQVVPMFLIQQFPRSKFVRPGFHDTVLTPLPLNRSPRESRLLDTDISQPLDRPIQGLAEIPGESGFHSSWPRKTPIKTLLVSQVKFLSHFTQDFRLEPFSTDRNTRSVCIHVKKHRTFRV